MDNVDGRRSCPTDWGQSSDTPPPPSMSDRLTTDLGRAVHGAVFVRLGIFLCLRNHQEKRVGVVKLRSSSAPHLLPASPLRSQIAHFPFSTTCCRKSEATSLTHLAWTSPLIRIPVPYLVFADRTSPSPREGKGKGVCVPVTAVSAEPVCAAHG